jgi:hypothetical protein
MQLPPFLQNQKVQIGIIAVGILIGLIALFTQILGSSSAPPADMAMSPYGPYGGGPPGAPNGPGGMPGMYGPPGGPGGPAGSPYGPPGYGSDPYGTGTGTAATTTTEQKKAGPKPPRDKDPFLATTTAQQRQVEAQAAASTEQPPIQMATGATPPLYEAYRWEKAQEEAATGQAPESPDIPMRMAGVLWGPRVYGLLEVNGEVNSYTPGDTVATIYRVERIERDRMVLSKRLANGKRKMIDVPLASNPYLQGQTGADPNAYPGAPGMGGYPGSGPGAPYPGGGGGYAPPLPGP